MRTQLRALLLADAAVIAAAGQKVYWNRRPQGDTGPAIVLVLVESRPGYTMAGRDGLEDAFVTVECWGGKVAEAAAVAEAVRALADGQPKTGLRALFLEGERDGSEYAPPNDFHCISLDLRVWRPTA